MYFPYGTAETDYLAAHDKRLGRVIEQVGHIEREVDPDLFASVVHKIVGQQVSSKAQATVWARMQAAYGGMRPEELAAADPQELRALGLSMRKVGYIQGFAAKVASGSFNLDAVAALPDGEVVAALTSLDGVGTWTAEMILLFCLQRPDVLSYGDLGIRRGICRLYHHKELPRERFERYRRRYSPYGSVASLYLWAVAGGAMDPALP